MVTGSAIRILGALVFAIAPALVANAEAPGKPAGVYAYLQTPHFFATGKGRVELRHEGHLSALYEVIERDYVAGITYYVPWGLLEPEEGSFRWELVDHVITEVGRRGKTVNLGIFSRDAPKWLRDDPGVARIRQAFRRQGTGETIEREVPFVLDPRYVEAYNNMVRALAAHPVDGSGPRFSEHPALGYVAVGGPSNGSGLETFLQVVPEQASAIRRQLGSRSGSGDWEAEYARAWIEAHDLYREQFPESMLSIALSFGLDTGERDDRTAGVAEKLFRMLEASDRRPALMTLNLTGAGWWYSDGDGRNVPRRIIGLVEKGRDRGFPTGFQMIGVAHASLEAEQRARPFQGALDNAVRFGADWIEVWVEDLLPDRSVIRDRRRWVTREHPAFDRTTAAVASAAAELAEARRTSGK